MAKILIFVYIMILFVFIFPVLASFENTLPSKSKFLIIYFFLWKFFVYFVHNISLILIIFLYFVFYITGECVLDSDCDALYPDNRRGSMRCFDGICKKLYCKKYFFDSLKKMLNIVYIIFYYYYYYY
jgi:hypothetical protein